jgi:hypothetical protein
MHVTLTEKSGNRKVGKIPVSTTEEASCPSKCPLLGTDCYARFGPLGMHWKKVGVSRGDNWNTFCERLRKFAAGTLFRHNQAGDLPQKSDGTIHHNKLQQLVEAARHLRAWTYTHYDPFKGKNLEAIKYANDNGFTVNLSADSLAEADDYYDINIGPVCVNLPSDAPHRGNKTPNGLPIVVCPAQTVDSMNCEQCKLCIHRHRKSIVGFLAHGTAKKRLSEKLK